MSKIKKNVTVRFYSVDAARSVFEQFIANYKVSCNDNLRSRIIGYRNVNHLLKITSNDNEVFILTVVKERNTWQVKAARDGSISGISVNQGIIGDTYYFCILPNKKIVFGFTTGPIGSLKSVAKFALEQFVSNRLEKINLSLMPKEKEFARLLELSDYSSLHFKINSSSLVDLADDAPQLIKNLGAAPYIENNIQLSLDLECGKEPDSIVTKSSLIEIVNYLSESDFCSVLKVKGLDKEGKQVSLDFGNAFINYRTELSIRSGFIDEKAALTVLNEALDLTNSIN